MPDALKSEIFFIESVSPSSHAPGNERYLARMRLGSAEWAQPVGDLDGMYEVRWFLNDHGIDDKSIAFAIEELNRSGQVTVSSGSRKAA